MRTPLSASDVLTLARKCGADDCGLVSIDNAALAAERAHIARAFPATRTLLSIVGRTHREPIRSPARSVANHEFHREGHQIDEVAARIVGRLQDLGIRALNPPMAFPMEMERFPERGWIVSHKRVAEAAGLGRMGIHRSIIHPKFGSFILLGTVLIAEDFNETSKPLEFNPCLQCKLCVAACPVGAIKPDGYFDFSACLTHNYQQFMGGFVNFIEDIAGSKSVGDFRSKVSYAETVMRWQSLSYGPNPLTRARGARRPSNVGQQSDPQVGLLAERVARLRLARAREDSELKRSRQRLFGFRRKLRLMPSH